VIRRRLTVTAAVLAALAGEWLGHSIAYYRVAGVAGLQAGLTSGVHDYMLPLGAVLLAAAALGATAWTRAWLALGRRLDRSASALARLRRGHRSAGAPEVGRAPVRSDPAPTIAAAIVALALPMAAFQSALYLLQENLERALHGMPAPGLTPVVDAYGVATWIQVMVALLVATFLVPALRLLRSRAASAERWERLVRAIWQRTERSASSPPPLPVHLVPAHLALSSGLWQRPPPSQSGA
jgi:hypothetical protein